jgi:hypothetical protein
VTIDANASSRSVDATLDSGGLHDYIHDYCAHDLKIDPRRCLGDGGHRTVDATFWVLAPANKSDGTTRGVAARWQIVEMHAGDFILSGCAYLKYVTQTILPLFSTRDVKLISNAVCNKTDVGLRAHVLVPVQPLADVC